MVVGLQKREEHKRPKKERIMQTLKCKICRGVKTKLFLKAEKCLSPKCPMVVKPYAPGFQGKKRRKRSSEYGAQLIEKQKLKYWYGLSEKSLKQYVKEALSKRGRAGNTQTVLVQNLEKRLDNVIYRLGFVASRRTARQLVSHNHFLVNGKRVNIPSFRVEKGDKIALEESSRVKKIFQNLDINFKKSQRPVWLKLDAKKLEAVIMGEPSTEEVALPVEISHIFEFYSR